MADHTTGVTVIDTVTGTQIGTIFTLAGAPTDTVRLGTNGSRVLIAAYDSTDATNLAIINTATGAPVADPSTIAGSQHPWGSPVVSADNSRVVITTFDGTTGEIRMASIDTMTGTQTSIPVVLTGYPSEPRLLGANGSRAVISAYEVDGMGGVSTQVAVIDTATGAAMTTPIAIVGTPQGSPQVTGDGSHALIATSDGDWTLGFTTRVAVIDTATGAQTGATLDIAGNGYPQFNPDGSRALV